MTPTSSPKGLSGYWYSYGHRRRLGFHNHWSVYIHGDRSQAFSDYQSGHYANQVADSRPSPAGRNSVAYRPYPIGLRHVPSRCHTGRV